MPRLVGRRPDPVANLIILLLVVALSAVLLEYFGVIDLIPGFGLEGQYRPLLSQTLDAQVILNKQL